MSTPKVPLNAERAPACAVICPARCGGPARPLACAPSREQSPLGRRANNFGPPSNVPADGDHKPPYKTTARQLAATPDAKARKLLA